MDASKDNGSGVKVQLIQIVPEEVEFNMGQKEPCVTLQVQNTSEKMIAFKVKTTHPRRYYVRPNTDVIPVGGTSYVKITLHMKDAKQLRTEQIAGIETLDKEYRKNKFLVVSAIVNPYHLESLTQYHTLGNQKELGKKLKDMWEDITKPEMVNKKLHCQFTYPEDRGELIAANNSNGDSASNIPFKIESPSSDKASNAEKANEDLMELRTKYNELVNFTVQLTAERDRYQSQLKESNKEMKLLKSGHAAKMSNVRDIDEQDAAGVIPNNTDMKAQFFLWQMMLVALAAFLMGRIIA